MQCQRSALRRARGVIGTYSRGVSQLKIDVEIMHPPALVWRALTEAKPLNEWFQPVGGWPESGARPGSQGRVFPIDDLIGFGTFDLDVVEAEPHSKLVTRWRGDDFTSEVTYEIRPIPGGGSRLLMRQTGFLGTREAERRETLVRAHQAMIERLRATVGRLSLGLGEGAFLRAEVPEPVPSRLKAHHRVRFVAVACVVIAAGLCGTAGAVWMARDPGRPVSAPVESSASEPGLGTAFQPMTSGPAGQSPAGGRTPEKNEPSVAVVAPPVVPPAAKPLVASYQTRAIPVVGLLGFDTDVTVRNPGATAKNGWTVVLKMPDATAVQNQSAAVVKVRQDGDVVTVTPVTAALPAGGSVAFTIRFPALIALAPSLKGCTIDGQACSAA